MNKLLTQLSLCESRVRTAFTDFLKSRGSDAEAVLILDTETYYTVAHDLLKLAENLQNSTTAVRFRREATFKTICTIRDHLIRHAYDKDRGDPFNSFAWNPTDGPMLKKGSVLMISQDPGFFQNVLSLKALFDKYEVELLSMHPQILEDVRAAVRARAASRRRVT